MVSVDIFFLLRTVKLQPQSPAVKRLLQSAKDVGSDITHNTPLEEFYWFSGHSVYFLVFPYQRESIHWKKKHKERDGE